MSRRTVVMIIGVVILAATAGSVTWLMSREDGDPTAEPATVVVRTTADPGEAVSAATAKEVVLALPARLAAGDASTLSTAARERFPDVRAALPADTALTVDESSWRRTGLLASLTVTATRAGQARRFALMLIWEDKAWRVSSTTPLDPA